MNSKIQTLIDQANEQLASDQTRVMRAAEDPKFELYHAALSLCSQKVRVVLAEKNLSYISHDMGILPPKMDNYTPEYVRLRAQGGEGKDMVSGYTGRTAIETEGFDPLVVPTLVDLESGEVIVDSRVICDYINASDTNSEDLRPIELEPEIQRQLAIIDGTPHAAILYGEHPDEDTRPAMLREAMPDIHLVKIAIARENQAKLGESDILNKSYEKKILKETEARKYVNTEEKMKTALAEIDNIIENLEADLAHDKSWVCGDRITIADLLWGVSLYRLSRLGLAYLWGEGAGNKKDIVSRPLVKAYLERITSRESFRSAILDWPGAVPF